MSIVALMFFVVVVMTVVIVIVGISVSMTTWHNY
jgi:hypothetical protein